MIYGSNPREHCERLINILTKIKDANLKISPFKCTFMSSEVKYLGHIINHAGIAADPDKISKIVDWPLPKCSKELKSFMGLCVYYHKFIKDYSMIASPLNTMLCKQSKTSNISWSDEAIESFHSLKKALSQSPISGLIRIFWIMMHQISE